MAILPFDKSAKRSLPTPDDRGLPFSVKRSAARSTVPANTGMTNAGPLLGGTARPAGGIRPIGGRPPHSQPMPLPQQQGGFDPQQFRDARSNFQDMRNQWQSFAPGSTERQGMRDEFIAARDGLRSMHQAGQGQSSFPGQGGGVAGGFPGHGGPYAATPQLGQMPDQSGGTPRGYLGGNQSLGWEDDFAPRGPRPTGNVGDVLGQFGASGQGGMMNPQIQAMLASILQGRGSF